MPFQLKSGADTFDFDITGEVSKNGARVGLWTVTPDNTIMLNQDAGGTVPFDVSWQVNPLNQLELSQANAVSSTSIRPRLSGRCSRSTRRCLS
jgi:hypothetical protein